MADLSEVAASAAPRPRALSDDEARRVLAEHSGLVHMIIRRFFHVYLARPSEYTYDDLLSIGQYALLEAWVRWDPTRGAWTTIACLRVRQRLAWHTRQDRNTTARQLASATMSVDPALFDVEDMGDATRQEDVEPEERVDRQRRVAWLFEMVDARGVLTARQREVLVHVLQGKTFAAIALELGISRQGAEIIHSMAVNNLRKAAVSQGLV